MTVVTLILCILGLPYIIYLNWRIGKTVDFRRYIAELCLTYNEKHCKPGNNLDPKYIYKSYVWKYSFSQMFLSFKPLKIERWFTPEEIQELIT